MDLLPCMDEPSEPLTCCRWEHTCKATWNLGFLLLSPLCRHENPSRSMDFFTAVHEVINTRQIEISSAKIISELYSEQFLAKWRLWNGHNNWKDVLGEHDFKLVTFQDARDLSSNGEKSGEIEEIEAKRLETEQIKVRNVSSVVELLSIIVPRSTNNDHFSDEEKESLGWYFRTDNGQWQFDIQLYGKYWNGKFPQLECFLWWIFHDYNRWYLDETLYCTLNGPNERSKVKTGRCSVIMDFPHYLSNGLQTELEKGSVQARYKIQKEGKTFCSLEFWTMERGLVSTILNTHSTVQIDVLEDQVTFKCWNISTSGNDLVYQRTTMIPNEKVSSNGKSFKGTIFVTNRNSEMPEKLVVENCIKNLDIGSGSSSRVIIFSSEEFKDVVNEIRTIDALVKKVASVEKLSADDMPVSWTELRKEFTEHFLQTSKMRYQRKEISFSYILPRNEWVRNQVLSFLSGNSLNNVLYGGSEFLTKQRVPHLEDNYAERRFYSKSIIASYIFDDVPEDDVFVVRNISLTEFKTQMVNSTVEITEVADVASVFTLLSERSKAKVFIVENDSYFVNYNNVFPNMNLHCLHYLRYNEFQWIRTYGKLSAKMFNEFSKYSKLLTEYHFVCSIVSKSVSESGPIVFISGSQGSGRSLAMVSIARKLVDCFINRVVLNISVVELIKILRRSDRKNLRKAICSGIVELSCATNFEKNVLEYWLMEGRESHITFEIIFADLYKVLRGLKKIPYQLEKDSDKELAMMVIRAFNDRAFPSARVWAVVESLCDEIIDDFGILGYELLSLSEQQCIEVLANYWLRRFGERCSDDVWVKANEIATKCIKSLVCRSSFEIADILLQCRLIAEIYDSEVLADGFSVDEEPSSLLVLYEKYMEKKLAEFPGNRAEMEVKFLYAAMNATFPKNITDDFLPPLTLSNNSEKEKRVDFEEDGRFEWKSYSFFHETVAYFLVARFIVKNLKLVDVFKGAEENTEFSKFLWNDALAVVYSSQSDAEISCQFENSHLCYFLNEMLEEQKIIASCEIPNEFFEKLCKLYDDVNFSSMCTLIAQKFCSAHKSGFKNLVTLLVSSPKQILSLYAVAARSHQFEFIKYTIESNLHSGIKCWSSLQGLESSSGFNSQKFGVIHWIVSSLGRCVETDIEKIKEFLKYLLAMDQSLLEQKDVKGRTPLLLLLSQFKKNEEDKVFMPMLKYFVIELGADVNAIDNKNNTVLHFTHECYMVVENENGPCHEKIFMANAFAEIIRFFINHGVSKQVLSVVNWKNETAVKKAVDLFGYEDYSSDVVLLLTA